MFEHSFEFSSVDCTYSESDERTNTGSGLHIKLSALNSSSTIWIFLKLYSLLKMPMKYYKSKGISKTQKDSNLHR